MPFFKKTAHNRCSVALCAVLVPILTFSLGANLVTLIETTDGALGKWYPLLPRRVNGLEEFNKVEDYNNWDDASTASQIHSKDQYNICPDCGSYFGLEQDGGNGFCINCAWKH